MEPTNATVRQTLGAITGAFVVLQLAVVGALWWGRDHPPLLVWHLLLAAPGALAPLAYGWMLETNRASGPSIRIQTSAICAYALAELSVFLTAIAARSVEAVVLGLGLGLGGLGLVATQAFRGLRAIDEAGG